MRSFEHLISSHLLQCMSAFHQVFGVQLGLWEITGKAQGHPLRELNLRRVPSYNEHGTATVSWPGLMRCPGLQLQSVPRRQQADGCRAAGDLGVASAGLCGAQFGRSGGAYANETHRQLAKS